MYFVVKTISRVMTGVKISPSIVVPQQPSIHIKRLMKVMDVYCPGNRLVNINTLRFLFYTSDL